MISAGTQDISSYLENSSSILIIDGGLGTELESLGCDLNDPLWSGKTLIEDPSKIQQVEENYLFAGARCITTSSYQVTPQSFLEHRGIPLEEGCELILRSVETAKAARENFLASYKETHGGAVPAVFIAGSIGPYGAYLANGSEYTGKYPEKCNTREFLTQFHSLRVQSLIRSGVDFLALETQAVHNEILAVVKLVETEYPGTKLWVSCTTAENDPSRLPDGTPLDQLARELDGCPCVIAVGVNCVPLATALSSLHHLANSNTTKPFVVYPNSGEVYNAETKSWRFPDGDDKTIHTLAGHATSWITEGARIIGGCCRTRPRDIQKLSESLINPVEN